MVKAATLTGAAAIMAHYPRWCSVGFRFCAISSDRSTKRPLRLIEELEGLTQWLQRIRGKRPRVIAVAAVVR